MKSKTFVTIMKWTVNADLIKMTGQIPYNMHKKYGYNSILVTYKNEKEEDLSPEERTFNLPLEPYTYHLNVVKGLKLEFIEREGKFVGLDKAILKYILKNAKKIDVLNLYHYSLQTLIYTLVYKFLNKKGIVYITLDNDLGGLDIYPHSLLGKHPKNFIRNIIAYTIIEPLFLRKVDFLSNETKKGTQRLKTLYHKYEQKFFYQPYGIDERFIVESGIKMKSFEEKENIILTVGRIGHPQKNNELLLKAVANIDLKDWKVILAGKVDKNFSLFLDEYFRRNPHLKEKIIFTGHISDRNQLYDLYNRAKIFCMTSNFESFGIVMVEAGYFGDYIVTSNVVSADDITNNRTCGDVFPVGDQEELQKKLQYLIDNPEVIKDNIPKIQAHIKRSFLWENIIDNLATLIESRKNQKEGEQ
ncbi:glycosyltransferase family 4 protein [Brevinematales bacterium NS]|nr:glycosyltransferase family 4 protein [Brevinematales bacterium NS]